ncbi:LA_3696 family protein [Candidatus Magnetominusculus dajiuhuensis]|uniref:LA_3696 family protein n=1 Tax=Candidatus Magnetominusculus dajiuhuensis TaxID=3137712 RepID=UPI003B42B9DD
MSVITIPEVLRKKLGDDGAEALVRIINDADSSSRKDLATKSDLESAKADIIKWVAAMLVAQAALIAGMFRLLGLVK